MTSPSLWLVRGDDPSLVRDRVAELVDRAVGDGDRGLMVEEVVVTGQGDEVAALVDAARTPPFLTDRRVVVGRDLHEAAGDALAPLVAYLADPSPTTALVLVWESGRLPKGLQDAVKRAGGEQVDTAPGRNWVKEQLGSAAIKLDAPATALVAERLGEDVNRLRSLVELLESTFGRGSRLGVDDVEPFLGEAGTVPWFRLTDAIDRGDIPGAIDTLHRLREPGVLVIGRLHGHFGRMLALDGADVVGERQAAELLGLRGGSTFLAKKALDQSRRLGHDRVARAIGLLAGADLDLRGLKDWPEELVLEVLVARLAQLSRR
jgi:DNA polymerase III subunit delta